MYRHLLLCGTKWRNGYKLLGVRGGVGKISDEGLVGCSGVVYLGLGGSHRLKIIQSGLRREEEHSPGARLCLCACLAPELSSEYVQG